MISIIIPIGPDETHWQALILLLEELGESSEIILALDQNSNVDTSAFPNVKIVKSNKGRAQQMNAGASAAQGDWLWFLHADSYFEMDVIKRLRELSKTKEKALFYHTLKFREDGPKAMAWNERAVKWRSDYLKMPFGDQGFFIRKELFDTLGGYRKDLAYGEDHIFVWHVRQQGFPVYGTKTTIRTSARKYQKGGWASVTLVHVWHTIRQGVPERYTLLKCQIRRIFA